MTQENSNSNVGPQSCPSCGADRERIHVSKFVTTYTKIRSVKHKNVGSQVTPYVCTQCGHVQLFVDPSDFQTN